MHRRALRAVLALAVLLHPTAGPRAAPQRRCPGRYADSLAALGVAPRARETRPRADYVLCLRALAVYEAVSYGAGGRLRRQYHVKVRHGTGFAYRAADGRVLVATNHHVVDFPEVTGEAGLVEGVPDGALRVRSEVRIVASEAEPEDPSQPLLTPVLDAHLLDLAVLAPSAPLPALPYQLGRSAELRMGDAVLVRGYPLGAFPALNAGAVIGLGQRDVERGWDHEDFAVDALLNLGSSGSPVLAIACDTGEPELVGIYHAGYKGAQGLNVVVAIDGLRDALLHLRAPLRAPPPPPPAAAPDPAAARARLERGAVTFPFGGRTVRAERAAGGVSFRLLDPAWPLSDRVEVEVIDRGVEPGAEPARALRGALWEQLALVVAWRAAEGEGPGGRADREAIAAVLRDRRQTQDELVAALRAGAEGLERRPAGATTQSEVRPGLAPGGPALPTPTVILGAPNPTRPLREVNVR